MCGKKGWVSENTVTKPCPNCGRTYRCYYEELKNVLVVEEIVDDTYTPNWLGKKYNEL